MRYILAILLILVSSPSHALLKGVSKITGGASGDVSSATATATSATVARTLADHFTDHYNVKDWGAKCDGSTDDTTAFQTAYNTLSVSGTKAFQLEVPAGTCMISQIVMPRLSLLVCSEGPPACILKQIAGSNKTMVLSENFAALTGTGLNYGPAGTFNGVVSDPRVPSWFGMRDMQLDGNASAQTAGGCIKWYGNAQMMLGTNLILNCYADNIYTEASGGFAYSLTDWKAEEEGFFDTVISRNSSTGWGWVVRGPHDSLIKDGLFFANAAGNFRNEVSGLLYNGGVHITKIHTYTSGTGVGQKYQASTTILEAETDYDNMIIDTGSVKITKLYQNACGRLGLNCLEITPNAVFTAIGMHTMDFLSTSNNVVGVNIQAGVGTVYIGNSSATSIAPGAAVTLYKIRGNFVSLNAIAGNVTGVGSICFDIGGAYNHIIGQSYSCATHLAYSGSGHNFISLQDYLSGADVHVTGSPQSSDIWEVTSENTGTFAWGDVLRADLTSGSQSISIYGGINTKDSGTLKTTNYAATDADYAIPVDTTANVTISFTPKFGKELLIYDATGGAAAHNITIDSGSGHTVNGFQTKSISTAYGALRIHCRSTAACVAN